MAWRLTRAAEDDVIHIYVEGARMFGLAQADNYHRELETIFDLITANPLLMRERREITPPVRVYPHKAHLIIYLTDDGGDVLIVRVRHGREDWQREPI